VAQGSDGLLILSLSHSDQPQIERCFRKGWVHFGGGGKILRGLVEIARAQGFGSLVEQRFQRLCLRLQTRRAGGREHTQG
jgi:hypothetical protein